MVQQWHMYINGLVGHQGKIGCCLYCPFPGHCKGSHYYPICLKPLEDNTSDNSHDNLNPTTFTSKTFSNYKDSLNYMIESHNLTEYKLCQLKTGIVGPRIFLGLQEKPILDIPQCFSYDIMHLVSLNPTNLLISLWCGTITNIDHCGTGLSSRVTYGHSTGRMLHL